MLKYSIIIPTLNEEKLLPQLLEQLTLEIPLKQDQYEIIISDGGSKDATQEIAKRFGCSFIKHDSPIKENISAGRNKGGNRAQGEWLIFLNADVRLANVKKFFNFLEANVYTSSYLAVGGHVKVFPEEEIFSDKLYHGFYYYYFHLLNFIGMGNGRGECQIIRKDIFTKLGGYDEKLAAGEDFDLFKRIKKIGSILLTDELLVYESPRRFRRFGYFTVSMMWLKNSSSIVLRKKSISREWEEVR
ncbi:MAG: glycosyltransferase [Ignavibacteriaceae bacterium]|jgi:glycosyltransferase involved in cell wall biosynthesis